MKNNKGMMTIEACVIIPLSLVITFLLLWTGILLYDRAAVHYAVATAVVQGSRRAEDGNDEIRTLVQKKIAELLEHKLVLLREEEMETTVQVTYGKITASVSGRMNVPAFAKEHGIWEVSAQHSADRMRSSQIVRTLQRIDRLAETYTGAAETEEQEE